MKLIAMIASLLSTMVASHPGLLRVPKVYNAVITSNQNLSPSRAFPVIQPVIHRTAFGYVPPFYYAQVAPHLAGPEIVHSPPRDNSEKLPTSTESATDAAPAESESQQDDPNSTKESNEGKNNDDNNDNNDNNDNDDQRTKDKTTPDQQDKKNDEQVPLSFYPNYRSLYYDPYFYAYNSFEPHLLPGTYYVDYQPYGAIPPIPPTPLAIDHAEPLLPGYHEERKVEKSKGDDRDKIPDVPPPPVPTSMPESSS